MKTIIQRATHAANVNNTAIGVYEKQQYELGYIAGATEQQEIDIQRAIEWLKEKCYDDSLYSFDIDEFEQAMKGDNQ